MEEVELSFNNKRVKVFVLIIIPVILITALLMFLYPKYHFEISTIGLIPVLLYNIWAFFHKRKERRGKDS